MDFAKPYYEEAKVQDKIDFRIGDAIKTMEDLEAEGQTFDMVFIDADKDGYHRYFDKIIGSKSLLRPDGLIVAVSRALFSLQEGAWRVASRMFADRAGSFR